MKKEEKKAMKRAFRAITQIEAERAGGIQIEKTREYSQKCEKCDAYADCARYDGLNWWVAFRLCMNCGFERQTGGSRLAPRPELRPHSGRRSFLYGERAFEMKEAISELRAEGARFSSKLVTV